MVCVCENGVLVGTPFVFSGGRLKYGAEAEVELDAVVVVFGGGDGEGDVYADEGAHDEDAEAESGVVVVVACVEVEALVVDEAPVVEEDEAELFEEAYGVFGAEVGVGVAAGGLAAFKASDVVVAEAAHGVGAAEAEAFVEGDVSVAVVDHAADASEELEGLLAFFEDGDPLCGVEFDFVVVDVAAEGAAGDVLEE